MQYPAAPPEHDAMTAPLPPSDTDRIIAAQREESRKTRVLLAWIFIGIPLIGLASWGIVVFGMSTGNAPSGDTNPTPTAPISVITDSTPCSVVNAWATDGALDAYTGGFADGDRGAFQNECTMNPTESAGAALANVHGPHFASPTG